MSNYLISGFGIIIILIASRFVYLIQNHRSIDWIKQYNILIVAIAITTFLTALDYFSAKPSLSIRSFFIKSEAHFMTNYIKEFYIINEISTPKAIFNDILLKKLFDDYNTSFPSPLSNPNASGKETIEAIKNSKRVFSNYTFDRRTDRLIDQLGKYEYKKRVWSSSTGTLIQKVTIKNILDYAKKVLDNKDYYIFLCSVLHSRMIDNSISVKNDGEVDLSNIEIIVPYPYTHFYGNRQNSLISESVYGHPLHTSKKFNDHIIYQIPKLKVNESLFLTIYTRENRIDSDEIATKYEAVKYVNKKQSLWTCACLFLIMSFLATFSINKKFSNH